MISVAADGAVRFVFFRKGVQNVSVAGTFNGWRPGDVKMCPAGNGWWEVEAHLPPGEHRFRYVADDQWFADYAAHGVELGKNGWDSILVVRKGAATLPAAPAGVSVDLPVVRPTAAVAAVA
ncbi:MAG TPA: glycogen-binding domain-containing protein [Tepidisphaeraceae bacterium]|nr:glycogen-binding domain-containing protein [Tepidisphaeraceae bacterium]